MNKEIFPDFIGIGAMRSGTSWLAKNLMMHPGIWIPKIKELHYFDRSREYFSPSYLASDSIIDRIIRKEEGQWRIRFIKRTLLYISKLDLKEVKWGFRYFLKKPCETWYFSLFNDGFGKVKGEITPAYAILKKEDVRHIYNILPSLKIIYILRNPIERSWSHYSKGNRTGNESIEEIKKHLNFEGIDYRNNYLNTINTWTRVFPENQILICFFDEIKSDPNNLLNRILNFLEIEYTEQFKFPMINKKINVSKKIKMPDEIKFYLTEKYKDQILGINKMFGGYTDEWVKDLETTLN